MNRKFIMYTVDVPAISSHHFNCRGCFSNHGNMKKKKVAIATLRKKFTHFHKLFSQNNALETLLRQRIRQLVPD